ncbi:MAG: helix-hairpin-helix domain-containing protein, partial [Caldilineaceae bacterium]|nr:helix-hairpin-helix domain-containing protein [Caldilineaceae bacterium]
PTGKKPVLKAMMTTACERNCFYCPFRAGRTKTQRLTFTPDEMAKSFQTLHRANVADGLFLSSGIIKGGVTTQDKIIDTAEILRHKYNYQGYLHLKIMPSAEVDQIRRAMQLATRVSINLEGATAARLQQLAPKKDYWNELFQRLQWISQLRQQEALRASIVTQFVVGAVGDTDTELLEVTEKLYHRLGLQRTYYMAFGPVAQTPFEDRPATSKQREFRLYQASFLLRDYGWQLEDLAFEQVANLRLDVDPKQAWAEEYLRQAPVEINHASRADLLRVPGIGPKGADAIVQQRRYGRFTELSHLRRVGIRQAERAAPYLLLDGHAPAQQLPLHFKPAH